jgi:gluconokinase
MRLPKCYNAQRSDASSVIVVVMGVAGSGKSTLLHALTARLHWPGIDADDLHSPANIDKMAHGVPLTEADRGPWLDAVAAAMAHWEAEQVSGVIACSALSRAARDRLRAAARECLFVYLIADPRLIEQRLKARVGHFMPAALANSQFQALEPPDPLEGALTIPADQPIADSVEQVVAELARRHVATP